MNANLNPARLILAAFTLFLVSCGFDPGSSFEGFDGEGTRVIGHFVSPPGSSASRAASIQSDDVQIIVYLQDDPENWVEVDSDGSFVLTGLPTGTVTVVFEIDGVVVGVITLSAVEENQEITITLTFNNRGLVIVVEVERDGEVFLGYCTRGPGFYCQNQDGKNPNMSATQFEELATEAAALLGTNGVETLATLEAVAAAVCNTREQFLRHLATLTLNLVAGLVDLETPLLEEEYGTVGDVFAVALDIASGSLEATQEERNQVKDVLDRINDGMNVDDQDCAESDEDGDGEGDDGVVDECEIGENGKVTICHIPPGNPENRHTIEVSPSAWPDHQAHGDTCGPCE